VASIVTRTRKDGTRSHHVKYTDGGGQVRWEHVPGDKRAANARKRTIEDELHRNPDWSPPVQTLVGDYFDTWLEQHARPNVRPRVFANYEIAGRLHIKPELGALRLTALRARHAKALVAKLRTQGKSEATIRNVLVPLREMLSHAVVDELISSNPLAGVRLLGNRKHDESGGEVTPPTRDQIALLQEHIGEQARDALAVAIATGLRRGELFALRWQDVDFEKRIIRVRDQNYGGKIDEWTKTRAGRRNVPLFDSARDALEARKSATSYGEPDDLIFGTAAGTPMDPGNWTRREFKTAQRRAGLGEWVEDENGRRWVGAFRFHDLRHYAVSELIKQHANILLLARIAGHSDPNVTLRVYAHLFDEDVSEAAWLYDPLKRVPSTVSSTGGDGTKGDTAVLDATANLLDAA
jgi:integrase